MDFEGPAQTFNYMLLGFAVILACIGGLLGSMLVRFRALKRELRMLQDLEKRGEG